MQVVHDWDGPGTAREQLVAQYAVMLELETDPSADESSPLPPRRLVKLLEQALRVAWCVARRT